MPSLTRTRSRPRDTGGSSTDLSLLFNSLHLDTINGEIEAVCNSIDWCLFEDPFCHDVVTRNLRTDMSTPHLISHLKHLRKSLCLGPSRRSSSEHVLLLPLLENDVYIFPSLEVAVIQTCSQAAALTCVPLTHFPRSPSNDRASASASHRI